jgi:hypothetical protein
VKYGLNQAIFLTTRLKIKTTAIINAVIFNIFVVAYWFKTKINAIKRSNPMKIE